MSVERRSPRPRPQAGLRLWRSLVLLVTLVATATLASIPGNPASVSAETFGTPEPAPTAASIASPPPSDAPSPPAQTPAPNPATPTPNPPTASPDPATAPPDGSPAPTQPPSTSPQPTPEISPAPSASALPSAPPTALALTLTMRSDIEPGVDGVIRVEPGRQLSLAIVAAASGASDAADLHLTVPAGWKLEDRGGAAFDEASSTLTWLLPAMAAGGQSAYGVALRAPDVDPALAPVPVYVALDATNASGSVIGPTLALLVARPVAIVHTTAGRVPGAAQAAVYLAPDVALAGEPRFEVFRLRFEVANGGATAYAFVPTLEWSDLADGGFTPVVVGGPKSGAAFFASPEWVAAPSGGTQPGPATVDYPGDPPVVRSTGMNPLPELNIPPGGSYVVEFSVQATVDADYQASYWLRLTNAGATIGDAPAFQITMGDRPALTLTPGQRSGAPAGATDGSPVDPSTPATTNPGGLHAPAYDLTTDTCAACHRAHVASGPLVLQSPSSVALCASCHNGTGAPDVMGSYVGIPPNDSASRSYYQHDPTATDPAYATRPECTSCHNPHNSSADAPASGADGWTAPGAIAGAPAVSVSYSGGAPAYALVQRPVLEYELCLRCHSGYAALPTNAGQPLSRYTLDKGVELNPANLSYHPIATRGTNGTAAMQASLAGTSPYKLWNFGLGDTLRCVNCHADSRLVGQAAASGTPLTTDATLPLHASPERGLLIEPYRDRLLKGPLSGYDAADFALCFVCHSEAPFRDTSGEARADTNFRYHGLHVGGSALINHGSDGTSIDQPGDGGGLAVCAECHFRIHSSAYPVYGQTNGPRLVDFAPNVSGGLTPASWSVRTDAAPGTCALKCHSQPHDYQY